MKIVLVGGGTGGHFYPLIAVAEAIEEIVEERVLIEPEITYIGPAPFDEVALLEHNITYVHSSAGKMPRDSKIPNPFLMLKIVFGTVHSLIRLFRLYPDVIFSTGGYAAFPTLYAARILNIPVIIYDADATPGRVSLWSAKFARWIAVAHPEATEHFPKSLYERIANTGHPIRRAIEHPAPEGGHEFLKIDPSVPSVFVLGGSQGAQAINSVVLDALPTLLERYNVVHQAGSANVEEINELISVILKDSPHRNRYRIFGLLNTLALRMTAGITSLIVSRAGSGAIFEIASWRIPSIIVPIPTEISHDQTENAFSYARAGAAVVIEQRNLTPHLLTAEIARILDNAELQNKMREAAASFARPDAAKKIAKILIETALEHEN
ncbi:hypothetical protein A2673_00900 [Candidatus Kaiserbacteria bacterium RIFCSPHIGHO2_01_FULL_50_13]|uniref:UDP-N-acetylglucosamine--N-acetylmuramyl-(pentapeptide) pyrophosphoryl-undecaprenol N-acetylglucosamine transferase n=1 Tax=Candidatus Kaiserbacteria bacterium RIFCSPLOWO2_01_FULL_50_24 TaxID=1798507 RepID=A0A1F6EMW7_9BACT|nr:MAG: hypothetical protein A2673_00900 [Candidatus Kaiserbacteria bacterium RIFCSPHIGHO2_01_FULL_50_13]OGG74965.1 MAG: hypothetical protein A3A34_04070 [Candidatus Kaiserbacteria bacterium RIFCSPLOWO2_01_FULL_50_24]OGG81767.1 MAG: hypothetical protein A3H74_01145 [Candidatus Kaiserbacteria bacterium RIFCSPLOWO2_02_FULL_51_13]